MGLGTAIMGCKDDGKVKVKDLVEVRKRQTLWYCKYAYGLRHPRQIVLCPYHFLRCCVLSLATFFERGEKTCPLPCKLVSAFAVVL